MDVVPLDGNATGGDLAGVFAFDPTSAVTTCGACRDTHVVAALRAYLWAPGIVLRCTTCGTVQLRLVRSPQRTWLDLSGIAVMTFSEPLTNHSPPDEAVAQIGKQET
jgi:hypothetical protein